MAKKTDAGVPPRVMDIHAPSGTKVTPIYRNGKPLNGYLADRDRVAKHLDEGAVFTVDRIDVGSWESAVFLKEIPGIAFNSVCLAEVDASKHP